VTTDHPDSHLVDLPAGRFHAWSWGGDDVTRPTAVLVHGLSGCVDSWVRVGPALAATHRVWALDLRGHGASPKLPRGSYDLRAAADDVAAFIDQLGLGRPLLVGHSWGGAVSLVLAATPGRVLGGLVLEDPALDFRTEGLRATIAGLAAARAMTPEALRASTVAAFPHWDPRDVESRVRGIQLLGEHTAASVAEQSAIAGDQVSLLERVPGRVAVVRGAPALGGVIPDAMAVRIEGALGGHGRLVELDHVGHQVHRDDLDTFVAAVADAATSPASPRRPASV